jgi:uncharacterized protein YidB (DUF937 family)
MGLPDGLIGNVFGLVLGGTQGQGQGQDPLGSLLGQLAGGHKAQSGNMLLQLALSMLQQNGGLEGLLGKFREGGLSQEADSCVGTGKNMNISADQFQQIFDSSTISDLASRLGVSEQEAGSEMAQILPEVINRVTPEGQVPESSNNEISQALSVLANSAGLR